MKRSAKLIRHPSQLSSLSLFPGLRTPGLGRISLQDDQIDPETRRVWEQQVNHYYFACGCDKAALGLVLGVVGYLIWLSLHPGGWVTLGWSDLWVGLAVVIGATVLGKTFGLWMAQRKLNTLVTDIQSKWKAPPAQETDFNGCG
jgi:hypothetical protein